MSKVVKTVCCQEMLNDDCKEGLKEGFTEGITFLTIHLKYRIILPKCFHSVLANIF